VPVYGFLDQYLGHGIVGGSLYSLTALGAETAKLVLRLLAGAVPPQTLTEVVSNKVMFDWRQILRWGLREDRLPPNSEIYFREPTVWQRYSWQIAFISALLLAQAGLISVLLHERRRRRLAEVQSRQRMAELAHMNRYSTAGELTASIAHEINQPLGAILTNAETAQSMLMSTRPDIDELKNIVDDIIQDDRRASEVIRRMRSLLRKAPFEQKNLDLNELVRETVEFLSALAVGRKVELGSFVAPLMLPIIGDRVQLQQVIINLVVNAIDAMADTRDDHRKISIRTSRADNFAELSISDCGSGIPRDRLKEIFEPFFTSKAKGLGMGLSIARTIVEAHIWAENQPGGGASFRIRLPLEGIVG
jgi:signal transduction histidine kinase